MADPRTALATFSLAIGMDNVSAEENVQPAGAKPRLVRSRNTRLSKVPGMVSKAPGCTQVTSGLTGPCGGLASCGTLDSTVSFFDLVTGSRRVTGQQSGLSRALFERTEPRSAYYPAQVDLAGVVPGAARAFYNPATCYVESTGYTWFATVEQFGLVGFGISVTVIADDGREILAPTTILTSAAASALTVTNFLGLSSHGTTVILWFGVPGLGVRATKLTITSDLNLTSSGFSTIYTPVASTAYAFTQLAYDKRDTANVYLVCQNNGLATNLEILRITVSTLAIAAQATIIAGAAIASASIAYMQGVGLVVAVSAGTFRISLDRNATTLAALGGATVVGAGTAVCSCGFQTLEQFDTGVVYRVTAFSETSAGTDGTYVEMRTPTAMVLTYSGIIPHQTMIGQIASMYTSATDINAHVVTQACYTPSSNTNTYDADAVTFLADPSVDVLRLSIGLGAASTYSVLFYPVAKLGSDIVIRYPGSSTTANLQFITSSSSVLVDGQRLLVTYMAENTQEGLSRSGYIPRYAWLDLDNLQPRFSFSGDGTTLVAGALPTCWDGYQVTEFGPLRRPVVSAVATTGGGAVLTSGTYQFAVVVTWKDAQGQIHRSAPSNIFSVALVAPATAQPVVTAFSPITHRNGFSQELYSMTLYASEPDGTTLYAQEAISTAGVFGSTAATWVFNDIAQPVVDAFHPALYTDGSATDPLPAYCPNASLDATVVADRCWLLDAERSNRWWYSKPKESGIFFEMSSDLFIDIPSSAGAGVATSHLRDTPLFLASRGIWTVSGEGPDALLNPPMFSAPSQVSDRPCTQRSSVVKMPFGIMFASNDRFILFNGQEREFDDVDATLHGNVIGTAVFQAYQEVAFFLADGYVYVYNWKADGWTDWDTTVTGITSCTGVAQLANGKVLIYGDNGELWLMDPDSVSTTAQIDLLTGFVTFGGVQDDQTIENVLLQAKRTAAHGLTVKTATDYRSTVDATKTYTAAEVLAAVDDTTTSKRYALFAQPSVGQARAVQLQITETGAAGEAFQPINCTVELRKNSGKLMQAMRTAARK